MLLLMLGTGMEGISWPLLLNLVAMICLLVDDLEAVVQGTLRLTPRPNSLCVTGRDPRQKAEFKL